MKLLPEPYRITFSGDRFALPGRIKVVAEKSPGPAPALALSQLQAELDRLGVNGAGKKSDKSRAWEITLSTDGKNPRGGYRINMDKDGVRIIGTGDEGLMYGLQTLRQIVAGHGRQWPACRIVDRPAFATRGLYLDVTRGKVPRLSTVKRLIDRMAYLKMNHLQLYVEHVFNFPFDPAIGAGCAPLKPQDMRELDQYCRDRCIEFVPSLACFGHMGRILSMPAYQKLAEVEWDAPDWRTATWRQRLRGATINPRDPEARKLLTRMIDAFLPHFSSACFNICGDETYDLGRGKNREYARKRGVEKLYLDHLRFLRKEAARHGKKIMFWGDIMLKHVSAIPLIPDDCTVLDWGYSAQTDFKKCRHFIQAGLRTFVCPSTRGYQVVFNEVEEARANIHGYANTGYRAGADGLLVTDWGDMGHFNMRTCSLHGIALAAALSWNPAADHGRTFDSAFARQMLGSDTADSARFYSLTADTKVSSWPFMLDPFSFPARDTPTRAQARTAIGRMRKAQSFLERSGFAPKLSDIEKEELRLACRAIALNAEKALLYRELTSRTIALSALRKRLRIFARELEQFIGDYRAVWIAANKKSGVDEIERALKIVCRTAVKTADCLQ